MEKKPFKVEVKTKMTFEGNRYFYVYAGEEFVKLFASYADAFILAKEIENNHLAGCFSEEVVYSKELA